MTTYMLVDTTPMALPRGVYDSLGDLAQALGMTEAQLMAQTNARGSWERMFSLGKEPVRIVCVREKQEKRERPVKMKIKLAKRPPEECYRRNGTPYLPEEDAPHA